jgi:hypothetical protein
MEIKFTTNLDNYLGSYFPKNLVHVPRMGEKVMVTGVYVSYLTGKKLPIRLEVVNVTHAEHGVLCELWYNETDLKIATLAGAQTH